MTDFGKYKISDDAVQQAREIGVEGNAKGRLQKMARESAPFTHPDGNRRWKSFLLTVENGMVVAICRHVRREPSASDVPNGPMTKEETMCPDCNDDGDWCATCNGTGKVLRYGDELFNSI